MFIDCAKVAVIVLEPIVRVIMSSVPIPPTEVPAATDALETAPERAAAVEYLSPLPKVPPLCVVAG